MLHPIPVEPMRAMLRHLAPLACLCAGLTRLAAAEPALDATAPAPAPPAVAATIPATAVPYSLLEQQAFIGKAALRRLSSEPYWRTLLHTADHATLTSRIADERFFLSAHGRLDPEAELGADLQALFLPIPADAKLAVMNRFPGRCEWLCTQLDIDRERLPMPRCSEFEDIYVRLSPRGAAMVFPAAYMNTPASMFGHTLLMIRSKFESTLLSQSVNYAAVTTDTNGLIFAIRGIFGLYHGYYSFLPYYQKVQEYSDLDQRDIWEYDLNFNAVELRRMVLHIWELRGIWSSYYFFDENCSYNLLYLLDSARLDSGMHEHAAFWVIPLDTIKQVHAAGLISKTTFRPSRTTKVHHLAAALPSDQAELAKQLAWGNASPKDAALLAEDPPTRARVLDLSAEYLQSLRGRHKVMQDAFQGRMLGILTARSTIPATGDQNQGKDQDAGEVPPPSPPESGHPSSRLSLGFGNEGGIGFGEVAYRPAYHALTDPLDGYLTGSQIEFANLSLRWYENEDRVTLNRFDAINLRSFAPIDRFYQPVAWSVDTGVLRQQIGGKQDWHDQAFLCGGAGLCTLVDGLGMGYALVDADLRLGGRHPNYAVGAGPELGALMPLCRHYFIGPTAEAMRYGFGDKATNWSLGILQRLTFTQSISLSLELTRDRAWGYLENTGVVRALWYF